MEQKYRKYYIEWWRVRRSTIYSLIVLLVLTIAVGGLGWWALKHDWFAAATTTDIPKDAARIVSFEGDVRITRAATRETIVVTRETHVSPGDTIQTQADGRAVVQMADGSKYTVRPNSTVIIRDNSSIFGGTQVRVSLDDGQLNVRTEDQPENTKNVVEMLNSETQVRPQTEASFNADPTTGEGEIRISRGEVETTVGGQNTRIGENEFASVDNGKITGKERLLAAPVLSSPVNAAQIVDNTNQGANVSFNWQNDGTVNVSGYYLQVARSPYFAPDSMLVDRGSITNRGFRLTGLAPGTYYWRLKATSQSGQTSEWSQTWRFEVVRRGSGGAINVEGWNFENVGGSVFIVSGRTQPGLRVKAQGREAFAAADGSFRMQVNAVSQEINFELSDDRGNRAGFVVSTRAGRVLRRF